MSKKNKPESFYQNIFEHMTFLYDKKGLGMFHRLYDFFLDALTKGEGGVEHKNPYPLFFPSEKPEEKEDRELAGVLSTVLAVCFVGETALSLPSITGVSVRQNDFQFKTTDNEAWNSCVSLKELKHYFKKHPKEFSLDEREKLIKCYEVYEAMRGEIYNLDEVYHKEILWESRLKSSPRYALMRRPWLTTFYQGYILADEVFSFFEKEVYRLSAQDSFDAKPPTSKKVM